MSTRIKGKCLSILSGGTEWNGEINSYVVEGDDRDIETFAEATAGVSQNYTLKLTVLQDLANPASAYSYLVANQGTAAVAVRLAPYGVSTTPLAVTNKALTTNVATLTIGSHPILVGQSITVAGVDSTFNGTFTVTAVTGTTVSYAKTAANVTSVAATGTVTGPGVATVAKPWVTFSVDIPSKWPTLGGDAGVDGKSFTADIVLKFVDGTSPVLVTS